VDGDHSVAGARFDLEAIMPHVSVGGAVVFDDLDVVESSDDRLAAGSAPERPLLEVWQWAQRAWPDWVYLESSIANGLEAPACGIALRTAPVRHPLGTGADPRSELAVR
jgi:hypothetical protein